MKKNITVFTKWTMANRVKMSLTCVGAPTSVGPMDLSLTIYTTQFDTIGVSSLNPWLQDNSEGWTLGR